MVDKFVKNLLSESQKPNYISWPFFCKQLLKRNALFLISNWPAPHNVLILYILQLVAPFIRIHTSAFLAPRLIKGPTKWSWLLDSLNRHAKWPYAKKVCD